MRLVLISVFVSLFVSSCKKDETTEPNYSGNPGGCDAMNTVSPLTVTLISPVAFASYNLGDTVFINGSATGAQIISTGFSVVKQSNDFLIHSEGMGAPITLFATSYVITDASIDTLKIALTYGQVSGSTTGCSNEFRTAQAVVKIKINH